MRLVRSVRLVHLVSTEDEILVSYYGAKQRAVRESCELPSFECWRPKSLLVNYP